MRPRTVYLLSGIALVALGFGLGYCSSNHRVAGGNPVATSSVPSTSVPAKSVPSTSLPRGPLAVKPTPTTSGSGDATVSFTAGAAGVVGGVVVLPVPPAAPEECSPSDITVGVGQSAVAVCRSANYGGPIAATVTNPAIALVRTSGGALLPRYFYVTGLKAGTTTVLVSYPHGPTTRYRVKVHPTSGG
jgi:hypothetical protein